MTYKHLNLPINPIKSTYSIPSERFDDPDKKHMVFKHHQAFIEVDPEEILKEEIIDTFKSKNLNPSTAVLFRAVLPRLRQDALLHSDVEIVHATAWKKVICSVNWELTPNVSPKFYWFKTTKEPVMPPKDFLSVTDIKLFGVHYGNRYQLGINTDEDTPIESVSTNIGPLLVRTDIPHLVEIDDAQPKVRYALSIRFKNRFKSWEEAVELFQPLVK
jgi:hypothetical protein